jgi:RHS repeat-associated protein
VGGLQRSLVYDAAGRITAYLHVDAATGQPTAASAALDQRFEYDANDRLLRVETQPGRWTYGYDANGNRTRSTFEQPGFTQPRTQQIAADSNRLLAIDNPPRRFVHDAAGNTVSDTEPGRAWSAEHDLRGRLWRVVSTTAERVETAEYRHDTQGRRLLKEGSSSAVCPEDEPPCAVRPSLQATAYVHDLDGRLLGEYRLPSGAPIREYVWLHDVPVAVIADEYAGLTADPLPIFFVHADHIDTPRVVVDRSGALRWSWLAEPFGHSHPVGTPIGGGEFVLNLRMPGQYFDAESGLLHNWHRQYDASVGRYTQSDPIGLAGGINTYAYFSANPVTFTDPTGLQPPAGASALRDYFRSIFPPSRAPGLRSDGLPCGAGCGDAKSDAFVPDLFPNSCAAHDACYENQRGKNFCDTTFRKDMQQERPDLRVMSWIFFGAVYWQGGAAYGAAGRRP